MTTMCLINGSGECVECIAYGGLWGDELDHPDCPVLAFKTPGTRGCVSGGGVKPNAVCKCECQTCKRAWWAAGRPTLVNGEVVRAR